MKNPEKKIVCKSKKAQINCIQHETNCLQDDATGKAIVSTDNDTEKKFFVLEKFSSPPPPKNIMVRPLLYESITENELKKLFTVFK